MRRSLIVVALSSLLACGSDPPVEDDASGPASSSSASSTVGAGGATGSGGSTAASGGAGGTGGAAGDTWTSFASDFFATYCQECHGPGDPLRDYSMLAAVEAEGAVIRCGVTAVALSDCSGFPPPKQFPIDNATASNPKPSDADRDRLVAWIEAGLPE
jgi:hypothetical protein